jgi:hypothetical protein
VEAYLQKKRSERRKEIPVGIFNAKPTKQTVVIHNHHPVDTVRISECYVTIADECKESSRSQRKANRTTQTKRISKSKSRNFLWYKKFRDF